MIFLTRLGTDSEKCFKKIVIAGIFIGGACAPLDGYFPEEESLKNIIVIEEVPEKENDYYLYLVASYQHAYNQTTQAAYTFHQLFKQKPSLYAYYSYIYLLADLNQHQALTTLYEKHGEALLKAFDGNVELPNIFVQSLLASNKADKAQPLLDGFLKRYPQNEHVAYAACLAYLNINQLEKGEKIIDTVLSNSALRQKHFLFHFLKSKVLVARNCLKEALVQVEKSIDLFPRFDKAHLFKAMLLEHMGNINNAINGYKKFLDMTGRNEMIEKQIVHLLFSQQRFNEALSYLKQLKGDTPDYFADVALIEFNMGHIDNALRYVDKAIGMEHCHQRSCLLKSEILLQTKQHTTLMTFMRQWMLSKLGDTSALQAFLLLRNTGVDKKLLVQTLKETIKQKPELHFIAALVDLLMETGAHQESLAYLTRIAQKTTKLEVKSKALFYIGYIHFLNKEPVKLELALQEAVALPVVYPSSYNLLAYHYAQNNKNLSQALQLAEKALSAAPNCYYYMDTKGLILLRLGKKQEAKKVFQRAIAYAPDDETIKQHCLMAEK